MCQPVPVSVYLRQREIGDRSQTKSHVLTGATRLAAFVLQEDERGRTKLGVTQYGFEIQLLQGILIDWGIANRNMRRAGINGDNDTRW